MNSSAGSNLPPAHVLREYAFLADGERGVLLGPRGDVSWMCFPRWHDSALFAALIGGRGAYSITPIDRHVWGGYYEPGTLIWHSRWITTDSIIECQEALAYPGDPARAVLLRRITAVQGKARVRITLSAAAGFGNHSFSGVRREEDGVWRGHSGDVALVWHGAEHAQPRDGEEHGRALMHELELQPGQSHDLVLAISNDRQDGSPEDAERLWQLTRRAWADQVPRLDGGLAERDARQAFAVLLGLTSTSGGMVAAATTSLPERAEEGRNYDYRYAWIRDQSYAGQAAALCGGDDLLDRSVRFIAERLLADGPELHPAYTIAGDEVPSERRLELPGYPGGSDVVGNHANDQFQLDAFGEALLLFATAARRDRLDHDSWEAAGIAAAAVADRWQEPDAGIWELDQQRWAHSALTCVAGLRQISRQTGDASKAATWSQLADAIVSETARTATHPSGRWQRAAADPRVDAALLLASIRDAVPHADPRSQATLDAVLTELTEDGYVYRYRIDERPLGEAEGAFLICGFWVALALHQRGDRVGATRWFERTRAACGSPGLLSEEFDVAQRQLRGNLPQAFVHAALLESSCRLVGDVRGP